MPYQSVSDLPDNVRNVLPGHAQEIFKQAFNSAYDEYAERGAQGREETAFRVAWAAVKHEYHKNEKTGKWDPNEPAKH